jgi:carbonic anhydrase
MLKHEALSRVVSGVEKFRRDIFPSQREMFEKLRTRQEPLALFVTCADARVVPNLFTQTEPGEIFIERNPGNMIPPYVEFVGGVTAGVEYAMLVLKVPLVLVCGHTDCGVMKALLHPERAEGMNGLRHWMGHGMSARNRMLRLFADANEEEQLRRITELNVLAQIEHLKTHPTVHERLQNGEIEVRGWVYDIGDGSIYQADPATGAFETLGE